MSGGKWQGEKAGGKCLGGGGESPRLGMNIYTVTFC